MATPEEIKAAEEKAATEKKALEEKERLEKEQEEKEKGTIDPTIKSILDGGPDAVQKLLDAKRTANAESKDYRLALEKINLEKAEADKKKLQDEGKFKELAEKSEAEAADLKKKTQELFIDQALQVAAMKQGIIDVDGIKLADRSKCSIDEAHNVTGADEAIKDLIERKPYLFDPDKKPVFVPVPGGEGSEFKPGLRARVNNPAEDKRSPHEKASSHFEKSAKEKEKEKKK
ncbi:MAG: hypothetical protein KAR42_16755 [candidate division Zixibacteria bacterium]|nr:hypothetical protein [candidate division Zixibacteria bacterium]